MIRSLIYYSSGLWPCGVASYHRQLVTQLSTHVPVASVPLPSRRVFARDRAGLNALRAEYDALADQAQSHTVALIDYTDSFWNGSRVGEGQFPRFLRRLGVPACLVIHEGPGRTDPADTVGPYWQRGLQRLGDWFRAVRDDGALNHAEYVTKHQFRRAARIVTHSPTVLQLPGVKACHDRVTLLPMPTYALPTGEGAYDSDPRRIVLLLGFAQPSKGFDLAIEALPTLPASIRMIHVGSSTGSQPARELLRQQAIKLGVADRIEFAPRLSDDDLGKLLKQAWLGLAPFRHVEHSSSLGHMIAAGMPIVASDIVTTRQLLQDGAGMVLLSRLDVPAIVETIHALDQDSKRVEELRRQNLVFAERNNFQTVAEQLLRILGEICHDG